jgi:TRAP-type mannitol/chloroaromatic compound transport system substrate-binding protein
MNARKTFKLGLALALAGGFAVAASAPADAANVRWKMQSAFPSNLPHTGTSGVRFSETIKVISEGNMEVKFFEPNALVPALECFDAASKGSVESCWTTPGYHTGKIPSLAFFGSVPFGPGFGEYTAWKWFGGGSQLRDEIYKQYNLISFDSVAIGPETSGWFKNEITSLEQIKGLKMRFFGLGAKVMEKLGVQTQLLAPADIYPALERGVIDATEFSMPTMDIRLGFYQIAKNNYFPGWHQQTSYNELLINREEWNKLSAAQKKLIEVALGESIVYIYAESEALNPAAMLEMQEKHGVKVRRWPDEILAQFEAAWNDVVKDESAKDPLFKKVADSYFAFRQKYKIWGDAQSLKSTYLK